MKTYLEPIEMRRGSPIIHFVQRRGSAYELGTYHELRDRTKNQRSNGPCSGTGRDYNASCCITISKELYLEFIREAKRWQTKWKNRAKSLSSSLT